MEPFLITISLVCVLGALIYIYLSWNFNYWRNRNVNGPRPNLVFGNVPALIKHNRHMAFDMQEIYEKYKKSGERFVGIFMTRNPQILVIDPKTVREIMVSNFKAFRGNESSLWINRNVEKVSIRNPFFCLTEEWKERRIDVVGGLSANRLKSAIPIIFGACNKLTEFVRNELAQSKNVIDLKAICYNYTVEVVSDFIWGINADAFKSGKTANVILEMSRNLLDTSFKRTSFYYMSGLAPFLRNLSKMRFFPKESDDFFMKIQKDALELRLRNKNDRPDYLNYLIQLSEKKNVSLIDMIGHSMTVLLDAFETSAAMMYHALYYLASNQTAQNKLRKEIMDNLDEHNGISYDTLMELPYLDQCINETIRLTSPIPVFSRRCIEQTFLENSENVNIQIDPGMMLHIPTYAIHHDPEIFPNPNDFIPERFNDGFAKELTQKGSFLPFGDGPRICAGMRLGQLETKAGVFEIIRNFKLSRKDDNTSKHIVDPGAFIIGLAGDLLVEFELIK
ncbi:probable cytochrome P450 309a2 [Episyrphus balteatus]|uniref:probable cytochrome P450 309a2 n=1 Tax=Episyrphus balteatus TaxID=286459 RepID=UPI002486A484|nr:probable cytochrome P450 309a2 [Episyrphus balteatus]